MQRPNAPRKYLYCALPGCENLVEQPADGTSPRKYCSHEHRIEARRQRQRGRAEHTSPERPSDIAWQPAARRDRASRAKANRDKVRRSVLAVGIAALLAVTVVQAGRTTSDPLVATPRSTPPAPARPQPPADQPPVGPVLPPDLVVWVQQAQQTLASVEVLLGQVRDAEAALQKLPERSRARLGPNKARELAEHKSRLLAQQAVLSTAIDAYARLPRTQESLAAAEQRLATVDTALKVQPTAQSEALTRQLAEQREALRRETESLREEQTRWRRTVDAAATAPLPAEEEAKVTTRLLDEIHDLTRWREPDRPKQDRPQQDRHKLDGQKPGRPKRDRPHRPRDVQPAPPPTHDAPGGRPRDDTPVGAPPRPGSPDQPRRLAPIQPPKQRERPKQPEQPRHQRPKLPKQPKHERPKHEQPKQKERPGQKGQPKQKERPKQRPPKQPGCPQTSQSPTKTHLDRSKCRPDDGPKCRPIPITPTTGQRNGAKAPSAHKCPSPPKPKPKAPDNQGDKCGKDKKQRSAPTTHKQGKSCDKNKDNGKGKHKKSRPKPMPIPTPTEVPGKR